MIPPDLNRQELTDLAALDVFALLDEHDQQHFDRSFRNASVSVQREIMDAQHEYADEASLLCDAEPHDDLRNDVIESVKREAEKRFAPLGKVGVARPSNAVAGTTPVGGRLFWRAAAFILSGAVVVLAYFSADANHNARVITEWALSGFDDAEISAEFEGLADFEGNPNCDKLLLLPKDGFKGHAVAYHNEKTGKMLVTFHDMPEQSEPYRLRMVNADKTFEDVRDIDANLRSVQLTDMARSTFTTVAWQIVDGSGLVVMQAVRI